MNRKGKTLFDEEYRLRALAQQGDPLLKLKKKVNWDIFRPILDDALKKEPSSQGGRPPYDYLMMFKILILQQYYALSDEQMEFQINDRLSFNRFLDIGLEDDVPDRTTIWNFRERLKERGVIKELFNRLRDELRKNGLLVKEGATVAVDASFVDVPKQRNTREENATIKRGETPETWKDNSAKRSQKDIDARWAIKNKERRYGYKNHIKASVESKIIEKYEVTPASVHDSQAMEHLIEDEDAGKTIYADSAYSGRAIAHELAKKNITNEIHEKGCGGRPLTEKQKKDNRRKSKTRARIEHIFGFIQNSMGGGFIRSVGIQRAEANIGLMNITYNIFRSLQLQRSG